MLISLHRKTTPALSAALLCVLLIGSSGCNMFGSKTTSDPVAPTTTGVEAPYTVEMHMAFGNPKYYHGQLDSETTVQSALEASGALQKYRDMNIHLVRRVPEKSTILKMPISFNVSNDKVEDQTDYQLHMGDRIVIMPQNSNPLTAAMQMVGAN